MVCALHRFQNTMQPGLGVPYVAKLLASVRPLVVALMVGMGAIHAHGRLAKQKERRLDVVWDVSPNGTAAALR